MADWQELTWDEIQPGNTVDVDGHVEQVQSKGIDPKTNKRILNVRGFGPYSMLEDATVETYR